MSMFQHNHYIFGYAYKESHYSDKTVVRLYYLFIG